MKRRVWSMRRREFIAGLSGAVAWPLAARAQQRKNATRMIGVLGSVEIDDPEAQVRIAAIESALHDLGWSRDRDYRLDYRAGAGNPERIYRSSAELLALSPDVLLAVGGPNVAALEKATTIVPIVFVQVTDPVGAGFVESLPRPGGNATGFTQFDYSISGKWLDLLKQMAPHISRVAVLRDPAIASGIGQFAVIQITAASLGMDVYPIGVRDPTAIDRLIGQYAQGTSGGLIVPSSPVAAVHREKIIASAARYRLPAIYTYRYYVAGGGLASYGPDNIDQYRRAASYIDRIFKGEKPANLPVQVPTKYDLAINLKTAKALGLTVPETLLATADEVIQ
jgi:putative tryptophan/tyrosine transport system substrate-binding protein